MDSGWPWSLANDPCRMKGWLLASKAPPTPLHPDRNLWSVCFILELMALPLKRHLMEITVKEHGSEYYLQPLRRNWDFPGGASGKEAAGQCRRCNRRGYYPWVGKTPWRTERHSTPVLLPGKSHGQRSLAGYSPWGRKESDPTEWLRMHTLKRKWRSWTLFNG